MELSSIEVFKIISALNKEVGSGNHYLNNIYQVMNDSYLLKLHQADQPKKFIMINPKIGIWLSRYDIEKEQSVGYVTSLRRNLIRAKLIKFEQPAGERICIIHFETKKGLRKLICEFFREGNIVVVDENEKILSCLNKLNVRHREIFPGSMYKLPPSRGISLENFKKEDLKNINNNELEIAKWLGRNYSISKKYIEEILVRININNDRLCTSLSQREIELLEKQIVELIQTIKSNNLNIWIAKEDKTIRDISLIDLSASQQRKYEKAESLMNELDNYITLNLSENKVINKQEKLRKKVIELEKSIQLQNEAYKNNQNISKDLRDLAIKLSKSSNYKEILDNKNVEFIKRRNNIIRIPLIDPKRDLDEDITAIKLSSICFDQAKKIEKKVKSIEIATKKLSKDLGIITNNIDNQEEEISLKIKENSLWFEKFRWFISSEGILAIGGRDAQSNVNIIKKYAKSDDLVFHSDIIGSPFFILNNNANDSTIKEVAIATVAFSRAWKTQTHTNVYYVKSEQVKKGAPSGMYLPKGSFMIEGKKNIIKKIKLELAIGAIKYEGRYMIMSGPVEALKINALAIVLIQPGKSKSSDIAKIVKQKLISELNDSIAKIYKEKSIDEYLRMLPPGESEIVEK